MDTTRDLDKVTISDALTLEQQYEAGTLQLDYKSCEMMWDELAAYIQQHYPGRFMKIEVSEDGENGAVCYYSGDLND